MIKINLLPEELKKTESSLASFKIDLKGHGKLLRNLALTVILILAIMHTSLFFVNANSLTAFKALSKKYEALLPGKREYEALKADVAVTNSKAKAIENLMANRFSWSRKLNDLSESMTPGIWLTDIAYQETPSEISVQVKTPAVSHAGAKLDTTRTETKKVVLRYLNISGYASSMGEQGTALIGKFIKNMKDNPEFFSDFSDIKLESIKSEKYLDQEVMSFRITCQFKT